MPSTGSHEQAVSGRQAAAAAAEMGLPILAKSFSSLIRSLKLTPPFQSISFFLFLSLSLSLLWSTPLMLNHPHTHTHILHTHTHSLSYPLTVSSLSLSLFPSPQWLYPRVQMDTMKASSQPLSYPWPCRFYSSLIQQLLSSMAIVKETAHHQCALQHPIFSLLLFPSLSPMWHKGLSYTPPLLGLCQEPSSVRLLLYCMREIHLALRTRWSVKKKTKNREPIHSPVGRRAYWRRVCGGFFECCVELAAEATERRGFGGSDLLLITRVGLNSPAGESFSSGVDRSLVIWCSANQRTPCPSSGTF